MKVTKILRKLKIFPFTATTNRKLPKLSVLFSKKPTSFIFMEILHVSAECYPVAKAGGLGDVVGALPQYQNKLGHIAKVVMPMYRTKFLYDNQWEVVHKGGASLGNSFFEYTVIKERLISLDLIFILLI